MTVPQQPELSLKDQMLQNDLKSQNRDFSSELFVRNREIITFLHNQSLKEWTVELINLQNKQVVITNTHTERKLTHERTSSQIHQQSQIYIWFWGAECGHSTDIVCQRHLVVEEKPNTCLQKSWSGSSGWSSELLWAVSCRNYVIYLRKRASSHQDTKERLSSGESEITKSWFQG